MTTQTQSAPKQQNDAQALLAAIHSSETTRTIVCPTPKTAKPAPKGKPEPKGVKAKARAELAKLTKGKPVTKVPEGQRGSAEAKASLSGFDGPAFLDRNAGKTKEQLAKDVAAVKNKRDEAKREHPGARIVMPTAKPKIRATSASKEGRKLYDWKGHEAAAKDGKLPPKLDFSADTHARFRPRLAEVEKMAAAGDLAGLRKFKWEGFVSSSPKALLRWRDMCIAALSAKAKAK